MHIVHRMITINLFSINSFLNTIYTLSCVTSKFSEQISDTSSHGTITFIGYHITEQ